MLNHDCQWHPSDQNKSTSTISRNGKSNYNPTRGLSSRAQTLQPPGPRNIQPCIRGTFHYGENASHTTHETTFNYHHNTQFRNQIHQITQNNRHPHYLTTFGATSMSHDHQLSW